MRGGHGGQGRTRVRGTIGGLFTTLALLVLAAPASAAPPEAVIDAADQAFRGQTVTFTSDSTDDGSIASQRWDLDDDGDFDDGTATTVSSSFTSLGEHTVRLQVTDDQGAETVAQHVVTIVNRLPVPEFGSAPGTGFRGQSLQFSAQASDADPGIEEFTFEWDTDGDGFDDGTGASKSVTFDSLGAKTVRVRVTDPDGGTAVAQTVVTILNRNPTVSLGGPAAGFRGEDLVFTATGDDPDPGTDTLTFAWDTDGDGFDDGTGATKSVSFATLGAKTMRVQVTDADGGKAEAQKAVTIVNRVPVPAVSGPATGFRGQDLAFTAAAGDADPGTPTFAWDIDGDGFDDGAGPTKSVSFATLGAKTVRVQVTDDGGAVVTAETTLTIENRAPTATVAKSPAEPVDGDTVTFTATASDPDPGAAAPALAWDLDGDGFDDGTGTTASRAFATGTHTVRLRASDADGGSVTVPFEFTVAAKPEDPPPPPPLPVDTKAPAIGIALTAGQKLPAVLKSGLKLDLTTDEACTATITIMVDRATARRLKLDPKAKKPVVVGTLTEALASGKTVATVKLTAKTRKALKKAKTVRFGVAVSAKDAAGNAAAKAATLTLKKK